MIDQDAYLALMDKIVAEVAPEEKLTFDLAGERLADRLYRTGTIATEGGGSNEFQFIETATQVLQLVGLMVGTFEAIRKLYKSFRKKDVGKGEELKAKWRAELQAAGLSEATAALVLEKFQPDLEAALAKGADG